MEKGLQNLLDIMGTCITNTSITVTTIIMWKKHKKENQAVIAAHQMNQRNLSQVQAKTHLVTRNIK